MQRRNHPGSYFGSHCKCSKEKESLTRGSLVRSACFLINEDIVLKIPFPDSVCTASLRALELGFGRHLSLLDARQRIIKQRQMPFKINQAEIAPLILDQDNTCVGNVLPAFLFSCPLPNELLDGLADNVSNLVLI